MSLIHDHITAIVAGLPPEASVLLPVSTLKKWLQLEAADAPSNYARATYDLTVPELASDLKRKPSTIRGWIAQGRFPGAYRLNGREWRTPRGNVFDYINREQEARAVNHPHSRTLGRAKPVDLGAWRKVKPFNQPEP